MPVTSIRNETPSRLTLKSIEGTEIVLAPLQEKEIDENSGFFFEDLEREGVLSQHREPPSRLSENLSAAVFVGGFWFVMIALGLSKSEPWLRIRPEVWPYAVWGTGLLALLIVVATIIIRGTNSFTLVVRWTMQAMVLMVILAIGLGMPAATIYFFGGGRQALNAGEPDLVFFGRLIQLAFIATASLLPVLLFFLFDRYQVSTLRSYLYANLFRLDRSVSNISEVDAKYGPQIREAFGSEHARGSLTPGTRWPVLVCSFVITIGWIVALAPVGADFKPLTPKDVLATLVPQPSTLVFGFLGVYFFSLRMIARRYARGDLKPKAYTHIIVRIFIVAVLSWVLEAVFTGNSPVKLLLAFLFGITPDEFFTWAREFSRGQVSERIIPEQTLPLTNLEGIDIYDLGRLESEGIVNIEALAHHEFIDLIIETRVPVPRLVDWVDQAILYLHLVGGSDDKARARLREYGIRTATDLLRTWDECKARNAGGTEFAAFKALLGDGNAPYRLEVIRDALIDDEWMKVILSWRRDESRVDIVKFAAPSSVDSLNKRADEELESNRYGRALNFLRQSLQKQDTAPTRRRIAKILATSPVVEQRDADGARENATRAFQLAPDDYTGLVELTEIYLALEDAAKATEMYNDALAVVNAWPSSRKKEKDEAKKQLESLGKQIDARPTGVAAVGA
jgi:tetratricopeptide (TPR) repeat protein